MKPFLAGTFLLAVSLFAREPRVDDFRTATPDELAFTALAWAPGTPAVILDWVQWKNDIDSIETEYLRIKILTEEGKKYGDVEIPYIPRFANFAGVDARVTKPDGTVVPFNGKIYEKLIVRTGGVRFLAKTFSLPDVQPGCIVEYRYSLDYRNAPLLGKKFIVQRELPVMRETLWLRPYGVHNFFSYRLPAGKKPELIKEHYELVMEKVPPFERERYAPPEGELKPMVNFYYSDDAMTEDAFWKHQGKELTSRIEDFISGDPAPIHNAAAAAVAGAPTPEEKLRRLYAVTQKIRNLGYEKRKTEAEERTLNENRSAQDVLRNGYGHPSEIARLFVALARSAGFEAFDVRVATRDDAFFVRKLPIASQLDTEVAVVTLDGKDVVLDPGTPNAPFGIVAWQKGHVPGLKFAKKQEAVWYETPPLSPKDAVVTRNAALHVDGESLKGTVTVTYKGQEALIRRLRNHNDDEAATKKSLVETLRSHFGQGAGVEMKSVTGMKNADPEIVVQYDVDLPNAASFAGSRVMIPLSIFNANEKNPFAPAERRAPVYFEYPSIEEDDITLDLPAGFYVETVPSPADLNAGAVVYTTRFENNGTTVRLKRRMVIDSMFFPREQYGALRNVFSKVVTTDQEPVVLRKSQ